MFQVSLETSGFFQRVKVFALEVFDDGQFGGLAVVGLDDVHRHFAPAGLHSRPQTALAGDNLVAIADAADHDRLQQAVGRDALREFLDFVAVEILAGLVRIAVDLVDRQPRRLGLMDGRLPKSLAGRLFERRVYCGRGITAWVFKKIGRRHGTRMRCDPHGFFFRLDPSAHQGRRQDG